MRHICAWCKCETAPADGTADDDLISHGICEECKKLAMEEMEPVFAFGYAAPRGPDVNKEI